MVLVGQSKEWYWSLHQVAPSSQSLMKSKINYYYLIKNLLNSMVSLLGGPQWD